MFNEYEDILTVEQLCEVLKVGKNNAYRLLNEGIIKAFKNGKNWRIPKLAIKEYVEKIVFKV